jgi:hypothetical protein
MCIPFGNIHAKEKKLKKESYLENCQLSFFIMALFHDKSDS